MHANLRRWTCWVQLRTHWAWRCLVLETGVGLWSSHWWRNPYAPEFRLRFKKGGNVRRFQLDIILTRYRQSHLPPRWAAAQMQSGPSVVVTSLAPNPPIATLFQLIHQMIGHHWEFSLNTSTNLRAECTISPPLFSFSKGSSELFRFLKENHILKKKPLPSNISTASIKPVVSRQFWSLALFLPKGQSRWSKYYPVVFAFWTESITVFSCSGQLHT